MNYNTLQKWIGLVDQVKGVRYNMVEYIMTPVIDIEEREISWTYQHVSVERKQK